MEHIVIRGGKSLSGKIPISGAKNAALPLMAATLLTKQEVVLQNVPALDDIVSMENLLRGLGSDISGKLRIGGSTLKLIRDDIKDTEAPYE